LSKTEVYQAPLNRKRFDDPLRTWS
jgi:hypothetical protein